MRHVTNIFGEGDLYDESDLGDNISCVCAACMSIYSEYLSWANHTIKTLTGDPSKSNELIVLGCQVTDLAVLNDLTVLEGIIDRYPNNKKIYIGGCLGKRFDIPLPDGVLRLDNIRKDRQPIVDKSMVMYIPPFWIRSIFDPKTNRSQGYLFRDSYPLRIGAGCQNKCIYCTIRETRGDFYEIHPDDETVNEFSANDNIVLIADSPTANQIFEWCHVAIDMNKKISLRNVEPNVICENRCWNIITDMAKKGLLDTIHIPIQSTNDEVLRDMGRGTMPVFDILTFLIPSMKKAGVFTATNIIIDYKNYPNSMDVYNIFDYVSYNPYWNNVWDIDKAKNRYNYYLGGRQFKNKYPKLIEE